MKNSKLLFAFTLLFLSTSFAAADSINVDLSEDKTQQQENSYKVKSSLRGESVCCNNVVDKREKEKKTYITGKFDVIVSYDDKTEETFKDVEFKAGTTVKDIVCKRGKTVRDVDVTLP